MLMTRAIDEPLPQRRDYFLTASVCKAATLRRSSGAQWRRSIPSQWTRAG